jgi:hypothetical protein
MSAEHLLICESIYRLFFNYVVIPLCAKSNYQFTQSTHVNYE